MHCGVEAGIRGVWGAPVHRLYAPRFKGLAREVKNVLDSIIGMLECYAVGSMFYAWVTDEFQILKK